MPNFVLKDKFVTNEIKVKQDYRDG